MLMIIGSGLAVVGLALVLSCLLVIPVVLLCERISAWISKARARARDRKVALSRLRMWAIL
jgi:hypothetical protein